MHNSVMTSITRAMHGSSSHTELLNICTADAAAPQLEQGMVLLVLPKFGKCALPHPTRAIHGSSSHTELSPTRMRNIPLERCTVPLVIPNSSKHALSKLPPPQLEGGMVLLVLPKFRAYALPHPTRAMHGSSSHTELSPTCMRNTPLERCTIPLVIPNAPQQVKKTSRYSTERPREALKGPWSPAAKFLYI